jgi:hypothetical protein
MKAVEIYHFPGRCATVDDLLIEGIKSRKQLIREGKLEPLNTKGLFEDHLLNIYFQWFPPHLEANRKRYDWVSIEVGPEATDVFNREFRSHNDVAKYNASRMTLANYISQHERTKEMRKSLKPGQMIIWNPITAEPIIVGINDKRISDYTWQYLNEILVPGPVIPASEFKGYHKVEAIEETK